MKFRAKNKQIYDYGTHEALHGSWLLSEAWASHIEHPRIQENKMWAKQAQKALEEMMELHRMIGLTQP